MENDKLSQLWKNQNNEFSPDKPNDILKKAKKHRKGQIITILILSVTLILLIIYTAKYAYGDSNNFALGLVLMISSLFCRLIIELVTIYRKESRLISLNSLLFQQYLKKYYSLRLSVNFIITPICFVVYVIGFTKLLPYFKEEFSAAFYTYIVISGIGSLAVLIVIIINSALKEYNFLKRLKK